MDRQSLQAGETAFVALDPGETTGYAHFDCNGDIIRTGYIRIGKDPVQLYTQVATAIPLSTKTIIVENYRLYPWKSTEQAWSSLDTVRYIGAIEYHAWLNEINVEYQDPSVKPIAYKWAGIMVPKQKLMTHETDAFVHGVYFLQKAGIRKPQQGRRGGAESR